MDSEQLCRKKALQGSNPYIIADDMLTVRVVVRVTCVVDQLQLPWSSVVASSPRSFINTRLKRELQLPNQYLVVAVVLHVAPFQGS